MSMRAQRGILWREFSWPRTPRCGCLTTLVTRRWHQPVGNNGGSPARTSRGPTCRATAAAAACVPRSSRSATVRWASGKRYAKSSRRRRSSVVGSTSRRMPLLRFRSRHIRRAGGDEGNLKGRGRRQGAGGDHRVRTRLRREVPEGRRVDRRRRQRAAGVLPLPGGALDRSAHDEPIESTFATVRLRSKVTKGPGSRAAGLAMAFKLIEAAEARWRAVNAPHLVALVRAGAVFEKGKLIERPVDSSTTKGAA